MAAVGAALADAIRQASPRWLLTGSAGFIGSHLLETLLRLGQTVVSIDNFATGRRSNLDDVRGQVGEEAWKRHTFLGGDITDPAVCRNACAGADIVLHQAALGSVPRSIESPSATHRANVTGFLNMLDAARAAQVRRFVYASSSSVYGDEQTVPKVEDVTGNPLSPYAASKRMNEIYADVFGRCYALEAIGLRYFNVFGPRQDPEGAYAAVIPRWITAILSQQACVINGDGETSRDFCYVANAVQANLLAAMTPDKRTLAQVYNVAFGETITLNALHRLIADLVQSVQPALTIYPPVNAPFRQGDVRHSLANIRKARTLLGYSASVDLRSGLRQSIGWYVHRLKQEPTRAAGFPPTQRA